MRWKFALVIVPIACGSRAPAPNKPETLRELSSAYHLGGLRIEGAPPLDAAIAHAFDRMPIASTARLLDLSGDSRGTPAIVSDPAGCATLGFNPTQGLWFVRKQCEPGVVWAAGGSNWPLTFITETGDERSVLHSETRPLPAGRITDPFADRARDRVYLGLATAGLPALWVAGIEQTRQVATGGPWAPLDVSPDGRFVLARKERSTKESTLYRIDTQTGDAIALTESDARSGHFTPAGDLVAIRNTDEGSRLERCGTRGCVWIATAVSGVIDDVVVLDSQLVVLASEQGVSKLWGVDESGEAHALTTIPDGGVITDLRAAESTIGFSFTSPTIPRHVEVHVLDRDSWTTVRRGQWPARRSIAAVPSSTQTLRSSDGVEFQVETYVPAAAVKAPVVIELHSGPEDRWVPRYDLFAQLLVARGYAVVRPNVRGSTGQGRAFEAADDGTRRGDVLFDVRATLDWIAKRPDLDSSRVVVAGTSYGGYLALASVIAFPDRLRGAATLSPVTDFVGFLEGTAEYRRDHRRAEYGDERVPEVRDFLTKLSPLTHVAELKRPILVAYGQRDPRVPPTTTARFVQAARAAGSVVWSIAAADEGHWFEGPENRRAFEILTVQFLDAVTR